MGSDSGYNGWTNWATWNTFNWVSSDEYLDREFRARGDRAREDADTIEDGASDLAQDIEREVSGYGDGYADGAVASGDVDWVELATAYMEG